MAAAQNDDYTDPDDIGVNASTEPSIGELIERRLSRRDALRGLAGVGVAASLGSPFASTPIRFDDLVLTRAVLKKGG